MTLDARSSPAGDRGRDLRVLVVSGLYPKPDDCLSGVFIHRQVRELRARGVDARVLCPVARHLLPFRGESEFAARLEGTRASRLDGVPVTYVAYPHVPHRLSTHLEAFSLVRRLREVREEMPFDAGPDLVHGHWLFPTGYGAIELAGALDVPSVVTARGSDVHRYPHENRGYARYVREVIREADRVVSVSEALADGIRKLAEEELRVSVVRNGVDAERFRPPGDRAVARREVGLPEEGIGLCAVGRLEEAKGTAELMQAFLRIGERRQDAWLALVGDGPLRENVRSDAAEQGLSERVILPGEVEPEDVPGWLQASDVFALPSYAEGLPNVVLEAMACGLPVVATDVGGIPEAVDEEVGRLVPPRSPDALADALEELISDPALRRRLGAAGRQRVEEKFTWRRSAENLVGVYRDVLEAVGGGADASAATGARRLQLLEGGAR